MPDVLDAPVEQVAPGYKPPGPITIVPDQPTAAASDDLLSRVQARHEERQQQAPAGGDDLLSRVEARHEERQQEQNQPGPLQTVWNEAGVNFPHQVVSGALGFSAHADHLMANTFDLMDKAAESISSATGVRKWQALRYVADTYRQQQAQQEQKAKEWSGDRQDLPSQIIRGSVQGLLSLPEMMVANTVAGPVGGMAALGGLEESDKGLGPTVEGVIKGGITGAAYKFMGPAARWIQSPVMAASAFAEAKANGADNDTAFAHAVTMGGMGALQAPGEGGAGVREMVQNARDLPQNVSIPPMFPNRNPVSKAGADYMRSKGIEGNAATSSGSAVLQQIQKGADASPLGQIISRRAAARNEAKLRDLGQSHIEEATPETPPAQHYGAYQDIEDHPTSMREVPTGRVDEDGEPITQDMQMPVYIGDFKPEMQKIVARLSFRPVKTQSTSAALSSAKAILAADNYMPGSVVEEGLSSLKEEGRDGEGRSAALAKSLIPRLQDRIDSSVQDVNPEALDHLQAGRRAAADQAGADWVSKTLEPATVGGGFSLEKAAQMLAAWRKLSDGDKATMFSADQARDLENFFVGLNDLAKNQPGTGKGLAGLGSGYLLGHYVSLPVAGGVIATAGGISKLLHSEFGIRLLTEGLNTDPNTPRGRQIAAGIQNIVRPGGPPPPGTPPEEESQPGPDDEGGGPPPPPGAPPSAPPAAAAPPAETAPAPSTQNLAPTVHDVPENPRQWMIDERQRQAAAQQAFIDKTRAAGGQEAGGQEAEPSPSTQNPPPAGSEASPEAQQAFLDKVNAAGTPAEGQATAQPSLSERLQSAGDEALQRMRDRGTFSGTKLNTLFPPEDLKDMAIWGAAKIAKGTVDFAKWSKEMIAELGPRVKPQLEGLYAKAQKIYASHVDTTANMLPDTTELLKKVREGKAGKEWYTKTKQELVKMFGPDAQMMIDFLAVTSPNNTVAGNVTQALKAYRQWRLGQPFEGYLPIHKDLLNEVANDPQRAPDAGGLKVRSFRANLKGDPDAVTVDRWIRRAFNFTKPSITDPQYKFMDYTLTQIAKRAKMEPRQVQAAIWTAIKEADQKAGQTSLPFEELLPAKVAADPEMQALIARAKAGEAAPPRPRP